MLPKAHRVSGVTPRNCRWFEGISRTDAWTCYWLEILTVQKPAASPNCRADDDLLTDVNAKTGTQEGRKTGTQRRKGAKTPREEKKIGRGWRWKGMGKGFGFPLRLCALATLRLCVPFFKPSLLSLCVSIFMGESQVRAFR